MITCDEIKIRDCSLDFLLHELWKTNCRLATELYFKYFLRPRSKKYYRRTRFGRMVVVISQNMVSKTIHSSVDERYDESYLYLPLVSRSEWTRNGDATMLCSLWNLTQRENAAVLSRGLKNISVQFR